METKKDIKVTEWDQTWGLYSIGFAFYEDLPETINFELDLNQIKQIYDTQAEGKHRTEVMHQTPSTAILKTWKGPVTVAVTTITNEKGMI